MKLFYFNHNKFIHMESMPHTKITFTELTFLLSGSLEYIIDRKSILLKSGDVLCVRENSTRARKAFTNSDYISFNFYSDPSDEPFSLPQQIADGITNEIKLLLSACDEIHTQMTDDTDRLSLILQCILKQLVVNLNKQNFNPLPLKIKDYITSHLTERITLENIAKSTFFSAPYCSAVFRREMGKSIIDYVIDEKMKEAKKLIVEGMNFTKIAETLGFDDYNYFSRTFKRRVSYTPSQYKKSIFSSHDKQPRKP